MIRFFDRRFVIVMGKGGVGKSTVSAAIALAAARQGKKVLVCELKTAERMSRLFGSPPVGMEIGPVAEGIEAVVMTPESALREVALLKLRLKTLYRLTFENRVVSDFLRSVPGLPELLLLGKAYYHEQELDRSGRPRWDMVVVDAPATGHGIPFLRIPQVILDLFGESPITSEARQIRDLLQDERRTSLNLVTLPEELPTAEVLALKHQVDSLLHIPTGFLFVNQVLLPLLDEEQAADLDRLRERFPPRADARLKALVDAGCSWCRRMRQQRPYIDRLSRQGEMPTILLPRLFYRDFGRDAVSDLAGYLFRAVGDGELRAVGDGEAEA